MHYVAGRAPVAALKVGGSVANRKAYRGRLPAPSAATVAARASLARANTAPVCPACFMHRSANGSCGC